MYLLYVDESGDTAPLNRGGSKFLVLTGYAFEETAKLTAEKKLRAIKQQYYQDPDIEIKSNFLRYANPAITDQDRKSPIKLFDQQQYDALQKDLQTFLTNLPQGLISVVIDKQGYWSKYPSQNPYRAAYIFLLERFQDYLVQQKDARGICIVDPREGQVLDKKNVDRELQNTHHAMRWKADGFWRQCPNVIEKVLFSESDLTVGIQIADLFCYPIFHVHEYDKKSEDYFWYEKITAPKLIVEPYTFPKQK